MFKRFAAMILVASATLMAQGPRSTQNQSRAGTAVRSGAPLDMTATVTIQGVIESVLFATGVQYPSIVVNGTAVKIAPVWYLLDQDFELSAGDPVKVVAARCACGDDTLYALEITRAGVTLALRDSLGIPLWIRGLARPTDGPAAARRTGAPCLDLAGMETVTGTVVSISAGLGIRQPVLLLETSGGRSLSVGLAPERVLLEQDIELAAGMTLDVRLARSACSNGFVALELTTPDGVTIRLRDDIGRPLWPR